MNRDGAPGKSEGLRKSSCGASRGALSGAGEPRPPGRGCPRWATVELRPDPAGQLRGRYSRGTRREGLPATRPPADNDQRPDATAPPLWSSRGPESPRTSGLVRHRSENVTRVPRTGTGLHTAAAMFEKPRAEPRMPRNRHRRPAPAPAGPRALRLPQARPTTAAACGARTGGAGGRRRERRRGRDAASPGKPLLLFLHPPPAVCASRQKEASRSPCTQDRDGPPKDTPGSASGSIAGTRSPWPSPLTLAHQPRRPRTEKPGASLGTEASSMNTENATLYKSSLSKATPSRVAAYSLKQFCCCCCCFSHGFLPCIPLQPHILNLVVPLNPGLS